MEGYLAIKKTKVMTDSFVLCKLSHKRPYCMILLA